MNEKISIVVVCKNEAGVIERLLKNAQGISDDVVIYDNGSTDGTVELAKQYNVHLHQGEWLGFGKTKQKAVRLAKYDWILSLDADESLDEVLQKELKSLSFDSAKTVYDIPFKNFLGNKHLKWGEWGGDHHIRLFNRNYVNWNEARVHEELIFPADVKVKKLKGSVLHYTMKDVSDYSAKMVRYALLNAEKYFEKGKRSTWIKRRLSPSVNFLVYYILKFGFLDGWEGFIAARMTSFYTFLKYARLQELWKSRQINDTA